MGRKRSPNGYSASRLNAMKHGVLVDGIMKSRGAESCPHRQSCHVIRDDELRSACVQGADCPQEAGFLRLYVRDAHETFAVAKGYLSPTEFESTIRQLAIVELQRQRLSTLLGQTGITRPKRHPKSGIVYGLEESLAAGRYAAMLDNRFRTLIGRLLPEILDPEEQPAPATG